MIQDGVPPEEASPLPSVFGVLNSGGRPPNEALEQPGAEQMSLYIFVQRNELHS